jgi:hypothetical protein
VAKQAILAGYLALNATDISSYTRNASLNIEVNALDATTFGSNGWMENLGGIKNGTLEFGALNDVAASAIDSVLWPLLGTVVTFEIRLNSSTVSTSNPKYTGSVLIAGHNIGGEVGALAGLDLSFPTTGAIARATA